MRLEQIALLGFKSFAERTVLKVLPGITGIVGPNGCGKSNVGEAVRWALGEQSARSLRGQRMEDLIFHGSASRKQVGLAEVELLFSNDGTLAVPWSEIQVGRRLYRTGDSEYLLNGAAARLRDILDLFAGTGANPRAYSVMDQDKLNHVLTAKPHERRVFIEEAAGIARYKQQRHETEGKLDATRQNLVRVRDVMDEVRRQLGSLERQARRATQYKALLAERKELALALVAADHAALAAEGERLAGEIAALRDREHGLRADLGQLAARTASQRALIQESEHRLSDLRQGLQKVQGELERLLERREQLGVQLREVAEEVVRLADEARITAERLTGIGEERAAAGVAAREAEELAEERRQAADELAGTLEAHRRGLGQDRDRLEAQRLEQVRAAAERTDLMRATAELRERQAQLDRRAERLAVELREVEAEAARLVAARTLLESGRERTVAELAARVAERNEAAAGLEDRTRRLGETEQRLAETRLALAARRSSLAALRQLEQAREGYGAGVRAIFGAGETEGQAALAGVVGTVADLLEVPAGLERAVAAVLGERLQWVVVSRYENARAAVAFLRAQSAGAATFLPLDRLGAVADPPPDASGVRWAVRAVAAAPPDLVPHLLGRVGVVEHLDHAEALWRRNGVVATYVTPAGEVLGPNGRLRGGSGEGGGQDDEVSLLGRKRQVRELADQVAALDAEAAGAAAEAASLGQHVAELRERLGRLDRQIQAYEAERLAGDKDLEQASRDHERVRRHTDTVRVEAGQVAREAAETETALATLDARLELSREVEERLEAAMNALRARIEDAQAREADLTGMLTACRVELASATERVEALARERTRIDQMEAELTERLAQARTRQGQLRERTLWLEEERTRADDAARDGAAERDHREAALRATAARHEELGSALAGLEAQSRRVDAELTRLTGSVHELEITATEGRVRREEILLEARRAHGVDDEAALHALHDPTRDLEAIRARHALLGEKIEAIGAVNLVADDEYRELDERLTFLRAQHDDLVASVKDLEKALRGMTRTAQERFSEAFERINEHFQHIFGRLFEGGRAELRLVEAEEGGDPLDTGVELMAQPRGKRLQSVTLMSGGERALTGLALLFAIFYFRPSPFCVLDEVDAPLDDANIHRFLRVLRELTGQTQFIVITHNRKTMEAADVLYGVTMEEPGLSKVVSVNLRG